VTLEAGGRRLEARKATLATLCAARVMVYSIPMTTATLLKKASAKDEGIVVLSLREYDRLLATHVPDYYLTGKAATDLDKLVEEGLREHAEGETITASSISEALTIRRKQERKKK